MSDDLISRTALLRYIKDGLDNFPPFVDEYDKVDWILRWIEGAETAFDVDKVTGQLEGLRKKYREEAHVRMYKYKQEDWAQYLDGMQCGMRDAAKARYYLRGKAGCGAGKAQPFPVFEEKNSGPSFRFFRRICQEESMDLSRWRGNAPGGTGNQGGNKAAGMGGCRSEHTATLHREGQIGTKTP